MNTWELVKIALKYLQLSVMINYELPTGLSQNLISLLLPMSELPKRLNEPERLTERERDREGKPYTSLLFLCFIWVSKIVWYKLTFKGDSFSLLHYDIDDFRQRFLVFRRHLNSALLFILNMLFGGIVAEYKLRLLACWTTKCTVKVSQFTGIHERENFLMNRTWCHCLM